MFMDRCNKLCSSLFTPFFFPDDIVLRSMRASLSAGAILFSHQPVQALGTPVNSEDLSKMASRSTVDTDCTMKRLLP